MTEGRRDVSDQYHWLVYLQMARKIKANSNCWEWDFLVIFFLCVCLVLQCCSCFMLRVLQVSAVNEGFFFLYLMFQIVRICVLVKISLIAFEVNSIIFKDKHW